METYDIDPQILAGFIDETLESLETVESNLLALEKQPDDLELVNAVFRPIHSLKGTSGFFSLLKTQELSHIMEDLLDALRKGQKKVSKATIDALLKGEDLIRAIFNRVRSGLDEIEEETYFNQIRDLIVTTLHASDEATEKESSALPVEGVAGILDDLIEKLNLVRDCVAPDETPIIDHTMEILFKLCAEEESTLEIHSKKEDASAPPDPGKIASEIDTALSSSTGIKKDSEQAIDGADNLSLLKKKEPLIEEKRRGERRQGDRRQNDRRKRDRRSSPPNAQKMQKTMRISEQSIDSFLEYVGELVVVEEMFNHLQKQVALSSLEQNVSKNFKQVIETFSTLSGSLRSSIMEIRSLPVKMLLQKAPRLVRTVAEKAGKQVEIKTRGDEIRIDKSYVELLDAPLTHMLRNAVDHGIELPSQRIQAGKPETGTITITVQERGDNIELIVSEDGQGLNYDAIHQKAVELGLVEAKQPLDDKQIISLLFSSGVSTADAITDISGRGVGMDVVKKNIDAAGGIITVETVQGEGTTFTVSLPKTVSTQIVDGFLVQCSKEVFVLPMEVIGESFIPSAEDINTLRGGKHEMVKRRGNLMQVIHLAHVLNISESEEKNHGVMITMNIAEKQYALHVDQILGVQKVVVKHVDALPVQKAIFEGAAVMGDGSVAMIIATEGLINISQE